MKGLSIMETFIKAIIVFIASLLWLFGISYPIRNNNKNAKEEMFCAFLFTIALIIWLINK